MLLKRGVSLGLALLLCALALMLRLLVPRQAEALRTVLFPDEVKARVLEVFAPDG